MRKIYPILFLILIASCTPPTAHYRKGEVIINEEFDTFKASFVSNEVAIVFDANKIYTLLETNSEQVITAQFDWKRTALVNSINGLILKVTGDVDGNNKIVNAFFRDRNRELVIITTTGDANEFIINDINVPIYNNHEIRCQIIPNSFQQFPNDMSRFQHVVNGNVLKRI